MKPKLLDLFCGAGGASMGYYKAGFEVEGVDIKPQPHYPFKFYQTDALEFPLEGYDAYHASPPCQDYSVSKNLSPVDKSVKYPRLISPIRERLMSTGKPYVIENVVGSELTDYITLDGTMFGLEMLRTRCFELHGFEILMLPGKYNSTRGWVKRGKFVGFISHQGKFYNGKGYELERTKPDDIRKALKIDWIRGRQLTESIPPAYTEYIGKYLIKACEVESDIEL